MLLIIECFVLESKNLVQKVSNRSRYPKLQKRMKNLRLAARDNLYYKMYYHISKHWMTLCTVLIGFQHTLKYSSKFYQMYGLQLLTLSFLYLSEALKV